MTIDELRHWLFTNSLEDQWWMTFDGISQNQPMDTSSIERFLVCGKYTNIQVLHVSQASMSNPPWIKVEYSSEQANKINSRRLVERIDKAWSWQGLGIIDLIPGVRDLPYPVKFILMIFLLLSVFLLLGFFE